MNELKLLKDITELARQDDEGAKLLVLEFLNCDLTNFGESDMISCKMQSYIQEKQHGKETYTQGKSRESSGVLNTVKE